MPENSPEPVGDVLWAEIDRRIAAGKAAERELLGLDHPASLPADDGRRVKVHRCLQGVFSVFDTDWGIKCPDEDREHDAARRELILDVGKILLGPETEFEELT